MSKEEIYEIRIKELENQVRSLTKAQIEFREYEKRTAQEDVLRMFIDYVTMVEKSLDYPEAIKSGTSRVKHLLKEKYNIIRDDNGLWFIIKENGETVRYYG